jgi:hypothetical protein
MGGAHALAGGGERQPCALGHYLSPADLLDERAQPPAYLARCRDAAGAESLCSGVDNFAAFFVLALACYVVWQGLYLLATEVVFRKHFESDVALSTSMRHFARR